MNFKIKHYPQVRICDEFYAVIDFLKTIAAEIITKIGIGHDGNGFWGIPC